MITTHDNFDLTSHNTFAMKVKCGCFMEYTSPDDIPFLLSTIRHGVEWIHIGGGSNLLFTSDYPGVVLHSAIKGISITEETPEHVFVKVGAGEKMDDFIKWACDQHLWGVENLSGIPGEAGAAAVQNVGAYGMEAADAITKVFAYDNVNREFVTIENRDDICEYGYRTSIFKQEEKGRYVIHHVEFRLSKSPAPRIGYPALKQRFDDQKMETLTPQQVREAIIEVRDSKLPDPAKVPSAGSFFKNPVITAEQFEHIKEAANGIDVPNYKIDESYKIPAAWLIDQCGWKGYTEGNVAVWHLQPLVIVNPDREATPQEIIELEQRIITSVKEKFGITLHPEVEHI